MAALTEPERLTLTQISEEFCRTEQYVNATVVCTSLTDDEATARINLLPSPTFGAWRLNRVPSAQPKPCPDEPATHRHMVFVCGAIEGEPAEMPVEPSEIGRPDIVPGDEFADWDAAERDAVRSAYVAEYGPEIEAERRGDLS